MWNCIHLDFRDCNACKIPGIHLNIFDNCFQAKIAYIEAFTSGADSSDTSDIGCFGVSVLLRSDWHTTIDNDSRSDKFIWPHKRTAVYIGPSTRQQSNNVYIQYSHLYVFIISHFGLYHFIKIK